MSCNILINQFHHHFYFSFLSFYYLIGEFYKINKIAKILELFNMKFPLKNIGSFRNAFEDIRLLSNKISLNIKINNYY